MDKIDMIYDLLGEVRDEQKSTGDSIVSMQGTLEKNTEDMKHHIKRTDLLEKKVGVVESRVTIIEQPVKIRKIIVSRVIKWTIGLGALSGSIFGIIKLVLLFM